ncbi:MAG: hypothetical protein PHS80_12820 [Methanothrix sp.]|nr:hypothetical protein [Methanothrix sp.]MDD4448979.1 hypothetical protein [Methanothrix sp.]
MEDESPSALYKKYLPRNFISEIVFFELSRKYEFSETALDNLVPRKDLRGYMGGIILRGEGLSPEKTGQIQLVTNRLIEKNGKSKQSLLSGTQSKFYSYNDKNKCSALLIWHEAAFSMFAFELIALLNGTSRPGIIPSCHAMPFYNF